MKRVIGIDLDSVLNNLEHVWLDRYNKDFGDNLTEEDMTHWDLEKYMTKATKDQIWSYLHEPGFFYNLEPKPGAIETTQFLVEHFEVYVISASTKWTVLDKANWLEKFFPHIKSKNFVPLSDKNMFRHDYLIDDGPHNIEACTHAMPIIFDRRYNRHLTDPRYVRMHNWKQIHNFFKAEAKLYGG